MDWLSCVFKYGLCFLVVFSSSIKLKPVRLWETISSLRSIMTSTDPKTPLTNNPNKNGELEHPECSKESSAVTTLKHGGNESVTAGDSGPQRW